MGDVVAPSVLVVDDEPAVAKAHARLLQRAGLAVSVCTSSERALERIRTGERFDVVVCDGRMPGLSGVELLRRALVVWPELRERVVFLSGGVDDADMRAIRGEGLLYVDKPLRSGAEFVALVRSIAEAAGAGRARG